MSKKTPIFPRLKKKISRFLTDESWKITKKDALGLSAAAVLLSSAESGVARHLSSGSDGHISGGHVSGNYNVVNVGSTATCQHHSGVVNGHYSGSPAVQSSSFSGHLSHGSHSSHGSHGNGGWC